MKKWHMEGIVTATGRSSPKLELPDQSWKIRWAAIAPERARRDTSLLRSMRTTASRVLYLLK